MSTACLLDCFVLCSFVDFVRMVVMNSRGGGQEEFKVDTVSITCIFINKF